MLKYDYDIFGNLDKVYTAPNMEERDNSNRIVKYRYNLARGSLERTKLYKRKDWIDSVFYTYDERERLIRKGSAFFDWYMYYDGDNPQSGVTYGIDHDNNYNGNINATRAQYQLSGMNNTPPGFSQPTWYGYQYDDMNRLTDADAYMVWSGSQNPSTTSTYGDVSYGYDKVGNIIDIDRYYFHMNDQAPSPATANYNYSYQNGNNQLTYLSDYSDPNKTRSFSYDKSGNLIADDYRDLGSFTYDRANLPVTFTSAGNTVTYRYDTDDKRMYKSTQNGKEWYLRDAGGQDIGVIDITNDDIEWYLYGNEMFASLRPTDDEKYTLLDKNTTAATFSPSSEDPFDDAYKSRYDLRPDSILIHHYDHLGNTRLVYFVEYAGCTNCYDFYARDVLDYYPYAKTLRGWHYNQDTVRYQSTNHERDQETGLDYRWARLYDADIGVFRHPDPMRQDYPSLASYQYAGLNPIFFTDPTGKNQDWFVNSNSGAVFFAKGQSTLPNNENGEWVNIGGDEMFDSEDKKYSEDYKYLFLAPDNAENFMNEHGYLKIETKFYREMTVVTSGAWGWHERIETNRTHREEVRTDISYSNKKLSDNRQDLGGEFYQIPEASIDNKYYKETIVYDGKSKHSKGTETFNTTVEALKILKDIFDAF